jgi:anti-anti-sigma factor
MPQSPFESPFASHAVISVLTLPGSVPPVVKVCGEVDLATAPVLDRHLSTTIGPACPDIVVDLAEVSFMDAIGLSVLVRADNRARHNGGRVRLTGLSCHLVRLLRAAQLDEHFPRHEAGRAANAAGARHDGAGARRPVVDAMPQLGDDTDRPAPPL